MLERPRIALLCILAMALPAPSAFASDLSDKPGQNYGPRAFTVSRLGDVDMSCWQLAVEAGTMEKIIAAKQDIRDNTAMQNRGIGVAGAAAGFLVGTVTGGIGLAAAGLIAKEATSRKADKAESIQDIAEQRRALMEGIYFAKGCTAPMETPVYLPAGEDSGADRDMKIARTEPAAGNITDRYND